MFEVAVVKIETGIKRGAHANAIKQQTSDLNNATQFIVVGQIQGNKRVFADQP